MATWPKWLLLDTIPNRSPLLGGITQPLTLTSQLPSLKLATFWGILAFWLHSLLVVRSNLAFSPVVLAGNFDFSRSATVQCTGLTTR